MTDYEIGEIRKYLMLPLPSEKFEVHYTFYYDETNNPRRLYLNEDDFNSPFVNNFVLGGLVFEGVPDNVDNLFLALKLQKSLKDLKFKHIATGELLNCLESHKLKIYQEFLLSSNLYIHYSSLNILYWSLVDIVDSAIANSEVAKAAGPVFASMLKNDLYSIAKLEIQSVISLLFKFGYPNIKRENISSFIEELSDIIEEYEDIPKYHVGVHSLLQIFKESTAAETLPFVMDEEDYIILNDLSQFYFRPIYLFKNSNHLFDKEDSIVKIVEDARFYDGSELISNYSFIDSKTDRYTQLSDVIVGLMGKLFRYLNTTNPEQIIEDFTHLTQAQGENIDLLMDLMDKSHDKNPAFFNHIDANEEMNKMNILRHARNK